MAGLFSGASTGPALAGLADALVGFGSTIGKKLDEAEAASQFYRGQQLLESHMNAFDIKLSQDPNWQLYPQLNSQEQDVAWQAADESITNPTAKQALTEWWNGQKLRRDGMITNKVIAGRITQQAGELQSYIDSTIADPNMDSQLKKSKIDERGAAAVATNVVDEKAWQVHRDALFKELDKNDFLSNGLEVFNTQGEAAGLAWMSDPEHAPGLDEVDMKTLRSSAESSYGLVRQAIDRENKTADNSLSMKVLGWVATDSIPADALSQVNGMDWKDHEQKQEAITFIQGQVAKDKKDNPDTLDQYFTRYEKARINFKGDEDKLAAEKTAIMSDYLNGPTTSEETSRLRTFLGINNNGSSMTQEEEDDLLAGYYQKITVGDLTVDEGNMLKIANEVGIPGKYPPGAVRRFNAWMNQYHDATLNDPAFKLILDSYGFSMIQNPSEEQRAVSRGVMADLAHWKLLNPKVTDGDKIREEGDQLKNYYSKPYIKKAIATLGWGEQLGQNVLRLFGNDVAKKNTAELIQSEPFQAALNAGKSTAKEQYVEFGNSAMDSWYASTGILSTPTRLLRDKRTDGMFKGQYPLSSLLSGDTIYQLWYKDDEFHWYSLPKSKNDNAVDSDWTIDTKWAKRK